jgi:7-cyano-7-deazaguanine tRNA-ribosyltransferase
LDFVTPPGDNRTDATWKMEGTLKRIREAKPLVERGVLAGVQQGGRFLDLRTRSLEGLFEIGVEYLALGSLVPFFNRNHDLAFVGRVTAEAREMAGPELPIHIYGAGDPLELPFLFALGADIFDSASYGHYAQGGWYMTPYGALRAPDLDRLREVPACPCAFCEAARAAPAAPPRALLDDPQGLASHNLWTILETVRELRRLGRGPQLARRLEAILARHQAWFPDSALERSWQSLQAIT